MGLKNLLRSSHDNTYYQNMELLEDYDLINTFGSANKLFLMFIDKKGIDINDDEITEDLIEEFLGSKESIDLEIAKIQRQKDIIFKQRRVWISICLDGKWVGTDLILDHEGICIEKTRNRILYTDMLGIEICDGGWSKKKISISTAGDDVIFTINEDRAVGLKEIIEDNIEHGNRNEIDDLVELYELYESGRITEEEFEMRKHILYSDEIYCTNCGEKLDEDSQFCSNCGHQVSG